MTPTHCAHDGVALSECFTYSIGFRAPTYQEWVEAFLDFLRDRLQVEGRYADPDLSLSAHPGEIPPALIAQVDRMLRQQVRWSHSLVAECVGRYLSEPKPHLFFEPAEEALTLEAFERRCLQQDLHLDPRSQLLFFGKFFYFNGDRFELHGQGAAQMRRLADTRKLSAGVMDAELVGVLYDAWQAGWVEFF